MKFEKQFREKYPESVGEKDSAFDMSNYAEFLEALVEKLQSTASTNTTKATICPECGGEVLINKPSGNGFCVSCDYKVSGKQ